jgi:hypothetical protein
MARHAGCFVLVGLVAAFLAAPSGASAARSHAAKLDEDPSVRCEATQPRTIIKTDRGCTIIQPAGGTAWCVLRTKKHKSAAVTQKCTIRQAGTWRENVAHVVQVIEIKGRASPQNATQIADVRQGNQLKDNRASIMQLTTLDLRRHGRGGDGHKAPRRRDAGSHAVQKQEAHQSVLVCQGAAGASGPTDPTNCRSGTGMLGDNVASVEQTQRESEEASKARAIVQEQNTKSRTNACSPSDVSDPVVPDPDANVCANVDQRTQLVHPGGGENRSRLSQLYFQSQQASRADSATQCQGFPGAPCFLSGPPEVGGLDYTVNQSGPAPSAIVTDQRSLQIQRIEDVTTSIRKQDPRLSKGTGSTQGTHSANRWQGLQIATQLQFENGRLRGDTQSALLEYFGKTSGKIRATQIINQNGRKKTNSCSGSECGAVLACTTAPPSAEHRARPNTAVPSQSCTSAPNGNGDGDDD